MKRILPLLLIFLLLLSACGSNPAAEPDSAEPADSDPLLAPEEASSDSEAAAAPTDGPDEDELPVLTDLDDEPQAAQSGETVTLDGLSSYLRVTLPEGWVWEQAGGTAAGTVYALYPENDPAFKVEMQWWPDEGFAMCGTGITFSDYTLPDGQKATIAYEVINDSMWWTLILPEAPDSFTLQFTADTAVYEAHRAELEQLMGTIRQGILASTDGPDVVTNDGSTA